MGKNHKQVKTFTQQMLGEVDRRQQMIGKVVMCSYCGQVFVAKGTRKYCYGDECRNAEKRYRQSISRFGISNIANVAYHYNRLHAVMGC